MAVKYPSDTSMFKLEKGRGKGHRIWTGLVTIATTGDTVDTGLDSISSVQMTVVDATVTGDTWDAANVKSVAKGVITMNSLVLKGTAQAFGSGGAIVYITATGYVKGYAES